jgi:hypothetical protein
MSRRFIMLLALVLGLSVAACSNQTVPTANTDGKKQIEKGVNKPGGPQVPDNVQAPTGK